jgi:nucleoid DNA-binding protein
MTKRDLVILVADKLGVKQSDMSRIIGDSFEIITKALSEGDRLEFRDFGVFEVKNRASRIGRNPRTGESVPVSERRVVAFYLGKRMKMMVTGADTGESKENLG